MKVAVTGANGMIGAAVCDALEEDTNVDEVIRLARRTPDEQSGEHWRSSPELSQSDGWLEALVDADVVVHCAARAHVLKEAVSESAMRDAFEEANHFGALCVAKAALANGAKRFVFISSSGVVAGDAARTPVLETQNYSSQTPYGDSKMKAEQSLISLFVESEVELVLIRPPLVVAAHAPGNFGSLIGLASKAAIDPFAGIQNRRCVVTLGNLTRLIVLSCTRTVGKVEIFHPVEREAVSTSDLLSAIRAAQGQPVRRIAIPQAWILWMFTLIGKRAFYAKMFGDFLMDDQRSSEAFGEYRVNNLASELQLLTRN